jgi:hypothetical protein
MRRYLSFILVAACSGSSQQEAVFAGRSDAQIERAAAAVTGGDVTAATFLAVLYENGSGACPSVTRDAQNVAHVQGGCTTSDGKQLAGSVAIDNIPNLTDTGADPTKPGRLDFAQLSITNAGHTMSFDGSIDIDPAGTSSPGGLTAALDFGLDGVVSHDDFTYHCDTQCTYDAGSTIDVDGIGEATVTGTFTLTSPQQVMIQLRGADELDLQTSNGCIAYSGAATGELCPKQ